MSSSVGAFAIFAFVASITPGPTNILVLSTSARCGIWRSLPLIISASVSVSGIVLLTGWGLGQLINANPVIQYVMNVVGGVWVSWLAWQLYHADLDMTADESLPIHGWLIGAVMQVLNPKAWMMALVVVGVFNVANDNLHLLFLSLLFCVIAVPCLSCWAWLGVSSQRWLTSSNRQRWFNRTLALLLFVSIWWGVFSTLVLS